MTIGETLRRARVAKGLTVNELSAITGITSRSITAYETDSRDFYKASFLTVATLADWLGLGLDDLAYMATHEFKERRADHGFEQTLFEN